MRRPHALLVTVAVLLSGAVALTPRAAMSASLPTPAEPVAARVGDAAAGPKTAAVAAAQTVSSGWMQPGAQKQLVLADAGVGVAHHVGFTHAGTPQPSLAPDEAPPAPCQFEVVDRWYERLATGERRFHYVVRNSGSIGCSTTVQVAELDAPTVRSTGVLNPGETRTFARSAPGSADARLIGLTPTVGTAAGSCQFAVLRSWYQSLAGVGASSPVLLRYTVGNVGAIACAADVGLGTDPVEHVLSPRTLAPGAQVGFRWNNANPVTAVYLVGVVPDGANCQLEITRSGYRMVRHSADRLERELFVQLRNVGTIQCTGRPVLARI